MDVDWEDLGRPTKRGRCQVENVFVLLKEAQLAVWAVQPKARFELVRFRSDREPPTFVLADRPLSASSDKAPIQAQEGAPSKPEGETLV